jgi:hypothetical protein
MEMLIFMYTIYMPINQTLLKTIKNMYHVDQDIRDQVIGNKNLLLPLSQFGISESVGGKSKKKQPSLGSVLVYMIDQMHNARLRNIIRDYGYPKRKMLGIDGLHRFWLLIQHQDFDVELQKNCLKECDFSLPDQAHLTDRICFNSGKKQVYGSLLLTSSRKEAQKNWPIENLAFLNKRRKKMGLGPLK